MSKNIVLCSDGTGNSGGKTRGTNVFRIYNAIDRKALGGQQITFYDDGVGTSEFKPIRLLGGAFGYGLGRNIQELYNNLVISYRADDKIFLFGFSRGAFTVRSLSGLIGSCGVIDMQKYSRTRVGELVTEAFQVYKSRDEAAMKRFRDEHSVAGSQEVYFLGVWDTVGAIGVPLDEMRRVLGMVSDLEFHQVDWGDHIAHGFHALALDDERRTFHPMLWDESRKQPHQVMEQIWFAGVHANVGGGYPRDELALISLDWMMAKAEQHGLHFDPGTRSQVRRESNPHGPFYDSRAGAKAYYRYRPRPIGRLCEAAGTQPKIHASACQRIRWSTADYAPANLPAAVEVVGTERGDHEEAAELQRALSTGADERKQRLFETVPMVRKRVAMYFVLLFFTLALTAVILAATVFGPVASSYVYVYQRDASQPSGWVQVDRHRVEDRADGENLWPSGSVVQDAGMTLVGAPYFEAEMEEVLKGDEAFSSYLKEHLQRLIQGPPGAVLLYSGESWEDPIRLDGEGREVMGFGSALSLDGDVLLVGARIDPEGGTLMHPIVRVVLHYLPEFADNFVYSLVRSRMFLGIFIGILVALTGLLMLRQRIHKQMRQHCRDAWHGVFD